MKIAHLDDFAALELVVELYRPDGDAIQLD